MRLVALLLIAIGAGCLVYESLGCAAQNPIAPRGAGWVVPVVGGIAVVGGLILLVSEGREA
jgi:hypothetical protein